MTSAFQAVPKPKLQLAYNHADCNTNTPCPIATLTEERKIGGGDLPKGTVPFDMIAITGLHGNKTSVGLRKNLLQLIGISLAKDTHIVVKGSLQLLDSLSQCNKISVLKRPFALFR